VAVVDLETTGLAGDPGSEILEVGIVLLDPGAPDVGTLRSFVRPARPLSLAIQRLTRISDADVADAPTLDRVAPAVRDALAGRWLIAHNADFERDFLARHVDRSLREARYLDTQDLLALTHPDAPDLRLESFTRMLFGTEERHRALDDALDTARVLSRAATGARAGEARYRVARSALDRYAPETAWLQLLGKESFETLAEGADDAPDPLASSFVKIPASAEAPVPFDEAAIAAVLQDEERGRRHFPGYRVRGEQVHLAREFARALARDESLLLEGGTGVGKSLAYLAAAIPCAMERAEAGHTDPLVVSTRTKLLQDQLLKKDIPAAAAFLGHPELRALSIKGRANYVCERRAATVLAEGREASMFAEDRLAYAVVMACAHTRPHGEVGTLPAALMRRYRPLRDLMRRSVATRAEQCSREECARHPGCPFGRRRAALAKAQLVVANHDLLLRWPPDYPGFHRTIADEGHELAGVADEVYAITVSPAELLELVDDLFGTPSRAGGGRGGAGQAAAGSALLPPRQRRRAEKDVRALRRALRLDLTGIGSALAERASEYGEVQLPAHAARIFPQAAQLAETAALRAEQLADLARSLDVSEDDDEEASGPTPVEKAATALREAAAALRMAFGDESGDFVAAFERLEHPYESWRLAIRAVSPARSFHERFLGQQQSFSAVSASLFVAGDPFAALGELEIEPRSERPVARVAIGSPFPYRDHMRVLAMDPRGELVDETADVIADLARRLGGRTLGLFTSLRRMNDVAERLARDLHGEGFDILAPRRAADDPAALVERFCRSRGGGVLLGARTFWQGLDIPGGDLQAVVIEKLPFEVPTELRKRREAAIRAEGGDPFERYALGKMLLHLKQMVGRLIRTEDDRGLVVIVEARTGKRYFRSLPEAFPEGVKVERGGRADIPRLLAEIGLGR